MKTINKFKIVMLLSASAIFVSCNNDDDAAPSGPDFSGTFVQQDQMARPAINTVFIASGTPKDNFNSAIPSAMGASYQSVFQSRLLALNAGYTTNALGQDAATFTGLLSTDVLNVKKTGVTTFFDGTNVLTGRALADDVIDVELLLIFGGPAGTSNPGLTSDNVDMNDKTFSASFPYLASAW
ncbi:DUF4331 family protein [Flavobacterium sp.]|uniref:DUF4331 family protein n=1 Tax=Flavobacterium sp. TaxID=239 RepID=UPI00261AA6A0|nr:DUF4331 family protein [Flavobacterium sp.]